MGAPSTRSDGDERWDIESRNLLEDVDGRAEALAAAVAWIEASPTAYPTRLALVNVDDAGPSVARAIGTGLLCQHRATWASRPA